LNHTIKIYEDHLEYLNNYHFKLRVIYFHFKWIDGIFRWKSGDRTVIKELQLASQPEQNHCYIVKYDNGKWKLIFNTTTGEYLDSNK